MTSSPAVASPPEQDGRLSVSLFRGTLLVIAIQGLGTALRYASQVLFARWIGPNDYGNYSYAIALVQILAVVGALGLPTGAVRFVPEYVTRPDFSRLRGLVRRSRQLIAAAAIACAGLVSGLLLLTHPAHLSLMVLVAGVWLAPMVALSNFESDLSRSLHRLGLSFSLPMIVEPLVSIALAFTLMRTAGSLTATLVIAARCVSLLLVLAMQFAGSQAALPRQARECAPAFDAQRWLGVSFHLLLAGVYAVVMAKADVLILGLWRSTEDVGIYAAAATTAALGSLVLGAANAKGVPMMSAMVAGGDRAGLERVVHTVTLWSFWPALAVALMFWVAGGRILALFGPGFSAGHGALSILAVGHLVNSAAGPVAMLAMVTGHEAIMARVVGWSALGNVALCLLLIPGFGMLGAAFASAAALSMLNVWLYRVVTINLGIRPLSGLRSQLIAGAAQLSGRRA